VSIWVESLEEKCIPIQVAQFEDLVRFATSMRTFGQNSYILYFEHNGKHVYGIFVVFRDYYKYYGLPLFYYTIRKEPPEKPYLLVKIDERGENIEFSEGIKSGWIPVPIISLKEKPDIIHLA